MGVEPAARTIFEDEHIRVVFRPGASSYTLVTFSSLGAWPAGHDFWWRAQCEAAGLHALGVVAKAPNWFPAISMVPAVAAMGAFLRGRVVLFGYSHGGYGALKYAAALGADAVVSISPQYSIDPGRLAIADFFKPYFDPALHEGMEIRAADQAGTVVLVWDPLFARDDKHVRHIRAAGYPRTELLRLHHLGHRIMRIFGQPEAATALFAACLEGRGIDAVRRHCRGLRYKSAGFACAFGRMLLESGRPACAVRLLEATQRTSLTDADRALVAGLLDQARLMQAGAPASLPPIHDTERQEERLVSRLLTPGR